MNIVNYKKVSKGLYIMTLSNGLKYKIYDEIIIKNNLRLNKKIDEIELQEILKLNSHINIYYYALKYISIKSRTVLEVTNYLKKGNINIDNINKIITRLKNEKYLDDDKFISTYLNYSLSYKSSGPKKIKYELQEKGIDSILVDNHLQKIDNNVWIDKISKIIKKKYVSNKTSNNIFIAKTKLYLLNLGYSLCDIESVFESFDFVSDQKNFEFEANKLWVTIKEKSDVQRIKKFQKKMLQKGYTFEQINFFLENLPN